MNSEENRVGVIPALAQPAINRSDPVAAANACADPRRETLAWTHQPRQHPRKPRPLQPTHRRLQVSGEDSCVRKLPTLTLRLSLASDAQSLCALPTLRVTPRHRPASVLKFCQRTLRTRIPPSGWCGRGLACTHYAGGKLHCAGEWRRMHAPPRAPSCAEITHNRRAQRPFVH
jgi:hypothetical protein